MKCKVNVGDLREALQLVLITVDRRQGSELGYIYIGAKNTKPGGQRIVLYSTDSVTRMISRVNCEVEEPGELIVEPTRLASVIERQPDAADVTFIKDATKKDRVTARCGNVRCVLSSQVTTKEVFEVQMGLFPYKAPNLFQIEADNLKALLDRTAAFIFKKDGRENFKNVHIRSVQGGYEALSTNTEVVARASITDANSTFQAGAPAVVLDIPGRALAGLTKMLNRSKKETIRVILTATPAGTPNAIYFRTGDVFFGTSLPAEGLPPIDAIFTNQRMDSSIEVARAPFLDSVSRSNPFCLECDTGRMVRVELNGASLKLMASDSSGEFEEEIAASGAVSGKRSGVFRSSYLSDVLRNSAEENVTFKLGVAFPHNMTTALMTLGADNGASYVVSGARN